MGSIRRLDSNADIQAFPDAKFEIIGNVPVAQCSEAKIEGATAWTASAFNNLTDPGKFATYDLAGKVCTITASVGGNTGDFDIVFNDNNELLFGVDPGDGNPVEYYIHDGGSLILTRNAKSFAEFIHAAGYAYTIKAGKLYTNMPNGQLKYACSILFDPLT